MMKKYRIRKGDTVKVITGENKGQDGKVLKVLYDKDKVIVESVNMIKKHLETKCTKSTRWHSRKRSTYSYFKCGING